jgi:hypothetical protein
LKVLFDAFWWVDGPTSNQTVQKELIQAWADRFPDDELTLVIPRPHVSRARDVPAGARVVATAARPHGVAMALAVPVIARRAGVDWTVIHNFSPVFGRSAVFVHDFMFCTDPAWFTRAERLYFGLMPPLLRRAEVVFSSSQTEAGRIAAASHLRRPVVPIGLAISGGLTAAGPGDAPTELTGIDEFFLTVGRLNIRKNLATTIAAALESGQLSASRPLVVVGEPDGRNAELPGATRAAVQDGRIRFLARVSDRELAWLYRRCRLFVFLSRDEGYGLTPVEAAHFGAPVLVSDIAIFRETLGDYASFVAPDDVAAAAAHIATLHRGSAPDRLPASAARTWTQCVETMRAELLAVSARPAGSGR